MIEEWAAEGGAAQFRGHLTPEGAFIGTWQDSAKTKTLNVVLKETYVDGAIGLENKEFSDSFRLFEKLKNSPVASFGMDVLFPTKNISNPEAGGTTQSIDGRAAQPIIPRDLREMPRRPVNSNVS